MKMKKIYPYIKSGAVLLLLLTLTISGCKKFVETSGPVDSVTSGDAFATDDKTASVIRGLYGTMVKTSNFAFGGSMSISLGLSSDELATTAPTNPYNEFFINQISSRNSSLSGSLWAPLYNIVYAANQVIENVPLSAGMTQGGKVRALAEARFIRAVCLFYLTNMFGDVPMPLTTDYTVNAKISKTPAAEVYQQIITDLAFAEANLGIAYPNTTRIRANRYAATAMLARVYLYSRNWNEAAAAATRVIEAKDASNNLLYELTQNLDNVFLLNSREVIMHILAPSTNLFTWEGFAFVPSSATANPAYQATDKLLMSFSADDQRRTKWLATQLGYPYPNKYKLRTGSGTAKNEAGLAFLRLGEIYLIRAEARAELGDIPNAVADLEKTRKRAGLLTSLNVNMTKANFVTELANERFRELFAELGHRWLDLKRWEIADAVLATKPNWTPAAKFFPIPFDDITANPNLK